MVAVLVPPGRLLARSRLAPSPSHGRVRGHQKHSQYLRPFLPAWCDGSLLELEYQTAPNGQRPNVQQVCPDRPPEGRTSGMPVSAGRVDGQPRPNGKNSLSRPFPLPLGPQFARLVSSEVQYLALPARATPRGVKIESSTSAVTCYGSDLSPGVD
jgi:hypothetical protein